MNLIQVNTKVFSDSTGAATELPGILTTDGILEPLTDYLLAHAHVRSVSWMRKVVQAVMLFLRYADANGNDFSQPAELFRTFVQRLHSGTVDEQGLDPSNLYWQPFGAANARTLAGTLTRLSAWLEANRGAKALNPLVRLSAHEVALDAMAREYRRNRAFLGHVQTSRRSDLGRAVRTAQVPKVDEEAAIAFPAEHFERLITLGFVSAGRLNLRDVLITLLMQGAGLRMSECFHLWVHDVAEDPKDPTLALVRIHHPSLGGAPRDWFDESGRPKKCNRAEYLRGQYGVVPRTLLTRGGAAGWKNPMLDGKHFIQAHWFPSDYGRLFMRLWRAYLRQIAPLDRPHPYAFVNLTGLTAGQMYTIESFKLIDAQLNAADLCAPRQQVRRRTGIVMAMDAL